MLWRNRYLLSPDVTPGHFTAALHAALETISGCSTPTWALVERTIPADPTGEMRRLMQGSPPRPSGQLRRRLDVTRPRTRLLMVQTAAAGFDLNGQEQALGRIEAAFARGVGGLDLQASGPGRCESGPPVSRWRPGRA